MTGLIVAVTLCGNAVSGLPLEQRTSYTTGETDLTQRCTVASLREVKGTEPIGFPDISTDSREEIAE